MGKIPGEAFRGSQFRGQHVICGREQGKGRARCNATVVRAGVETMRRLHRALRCCVVCSMTPPITAIKWSPLQTTINRPEWLTDFTASERTTLHLTKSRSVSDDKVRRQWPGTIITRTSCWFSSRVRIRKCSRGLLLILTWSLLNSLLDLRP